MSEEKIKDDTNELLGGDKQVAPISPKNLVDPNGMQAAPGTEAIRGEDTTFPRLRLLQNTSSEVEEGRMKAGQLVNSLTEQTMDRVEIIPLSLVLTRVMFDPDDRKGAPVARTTDVDWCNHPDHGDDPVPAAQCPHTTWQNGHPPEYSIVYNYPFLTPEEINNKALPTMVSFMKSSSQAALKLNTAVKMAIPPQPFWNHVWELAPFSKKFKKGSAHVLTLKQVRETTEDERKWCANVYQHCIANRTIDVQHDNDAE